MKPWKLNLHMALRVGHPHSVRSRVRTQWKYACLSSPQAHTRMFSITPNWKSPRGPAFQWKPAQWNTKQQEDGQAIMTACNDSQKRCKGGKPGPKSDGARASVYARLQSLQNPSVGIAVGLVAAVREERRDRGWQQI